MRSATAGGPDEVTPNAGSNHVIGQAIGYLVELRDENVGHFWRRAAQTYSRTKCTPMNERGNNTQL